VIIQNLILRNIENQKNHPTRQSAPTDLQPPIRICPDGTAIEFDNNTYYQKLLRCNNEYDINKP
jgi:hypothetical protein